MVMEWIDGRPLDVYLSNVVARADMLNPARALAQGSRVASERRHGTLRSAARNIIVDAGNCTSLKPLDAHSAMPKSISHISPRCGMGIFLVEGFKQGRSSCANLFIRQRAGIEGQQSAENLASRTCCTRERAIKKLMELFSWYPGLPRPEGEAKVLRFLSS